MKEISKQHESVSSLSTVTNACDGKHFLKMAKFLKPPVATKSHIVNRDDVVWLRSWGLVG